MLRSWLYAIFHPSYVKRIEVEIYKRTLMLGHAGIRIRRLEGDAKRAKVAYEEMRAER